MTTIDDTTYSQGILKQKARDFERQMHGKEWRKTKLADQEELVQLKQPQRRTQPRITSRRGWRRA